ncbi:MAG: hypothetical protein IJ764_06640 [Bacteroidales bacterium]|nr:hypothetical protein [Bacteroidales bacterium]
MSFNSSDLIGKWKENGSSTYWRYDSGGSGLTWDESEDVSEDDETTMRFSWSLSEDVLQHVFSGDEIHQAVVQDYTILELSNTSLRWNTGLKTVTLSKVN